MTQWTQPICGACWQAYSLGARGEITVPVKLVESHIATCCLCKSENRDGIRIRIHPDKVPFPADED